VAHIRGTDVESPLGFPSDLIDRAVIIATEEYDPDSIREILRLRCGEEKVKMDRSALERLTQVGAKSSLRYAVQLLSLAAQNARSSGHEKATVEDVERVDALFMDIGEAAEHLKKYEDRP
jgi:DNA helicase TIP49 (TBP-interacting protein)